MKFLPFLFIALAVVAHTSELSPSETKYYRATLNQPLVIRIHDDFGNRKDGIRYEIPATPELPPTCIFNKLSGIIECETINTLFSIETTVSLKNQKDETIDSKIYVIKSYPKLDSITAGNIRERLYAIQGKGML